MVWAHMKQRCYYKRDIGYHKYGGRGIGVCAVWRRSFTTFFRDMGPRPSARHTLERINNDKGYGPKNCRWATPSEQARNRRSSVYVTVKGERMLLIVACERFGVDYYKAHLRLRRGWSHERALEVA